MVGRRDFLKKGGAGAAAAAAIAATGGRVTASELADRGSRGDVAPPRHLVLVLVDRSSSMHVVRDQTIDGLNTFLNQHRDKPDMLVSLLQFDQTGTTTGAMLGDLAITETFGFTPAPETPVLTQKDYVPRGGTPLYRAIAYAIAEMEDIARPQDKVLLAIQTDGGDTDFGMHEINKQSVKALIAAKESEGNWTFVFMGADIDAYEEAANVGVGQSNTLAYQSTSTVAAWATTSASANAWYRSSDSSVKHFYDQTPNPTVEEGVKVIPTHIDYRD